MTGRLIAALAAASLAVTAGHTHAAVGLKGPLVGELDSFEGANSAVVVAAHRADIKPASG